MQTKIIELESNKPSIGRVLNSRFNIVITWNAIGAYYNLAVVNLSGQPVMSGIKMVRGVDLFRGYLKSNTPRGSLYLLSKTPKIDEEPNYDNLSNYRLYHVI